MKRSSAWKVATAGGLAAATAALSVAALASLSGASSLIPFAEAHDARAYRLLVGAPTRADLDAAEAHAEQALALSPYSNSARLRLTYIDTVRRRGSLGPVGLAHLTKSYDLAPIDHTVAAWRVRFALEHWTEVTPQVRKAAEAEAMAFWPTDSREADVRSVLQSIQSPEGRLAAALWLRALARQSSAP